MPGNKWRDRIRPLEVSAALGGKSTGPVQQHAATAIASCDRDTHRAANEDKQHGRSSSSWALFQEAEELSQRVDLRSAQV